MIEGIRKTEEGGQKQRLSEVGPTDSGGNSASGRGEERPVNDASCCFKPEGEKEAR